ERIPTLEPAHERCDRPPPQHLHSVIEPAVNRPHRHFAFTSPSADHEIRCNARASRRAAEKAVQKKSAPPGGALVIDGENRCAQVSAYLVRILREVSCAFRCRRYIHLARTTRSRRRTMRAAARSANSKSSTGAVLPPPPPPPPPPLAGGLDGGFVFDGGFGFCAGACTVTVRSACAVAPPLS